MPTNLLRKAQQDNNINYFNTPSSNLKVNDRNQVDGLKLLKSINSEVGSIVVFDPQYRGVMDKLSYGNEGARQKKRVALQQMCEETIQNYIQEVSRVLKPCGHLFLWIDKFHLCEGTKHWFENTNLQVVDLVTWDKEIMGMGYRTRRKCEYMLIVQKLPTRAKGLWSNRSITDVWSEKVISKVHPHQKPYKLQSLLIESITEENDLVIDPCAGSYSVLSICKDINRNFIGSDLNK